MTMSTHRDLDPLVMWHRHTICRTRIPGMNTRISICYGERQPRSCLACRRPPALQQELQLVSVFPTLALVPHKRPGPAYGSR